MSRTSLLLSCKIIIQHSIYRCPNSRVYFRSNMYNMVCICGNWADIILIQKFLNAKFTKWTLEKNTRTRDMNSNTQSQLFSLFHGSKCGTFWNKIMSFFGYRITKSSMLHMMFLDVFCFHFTKLCWRLIFKKISTYTCWVAP